MIFSYTYCPIDLNITDQNILDMREEARAADENLWKSVYFNNNDVTHIDPYLNFRTIKIYENYGTWTKHSSMFPQIKKTFIDKIFPKIPRIPRIKILNIKKNTKIREHVDCFKNQYGQMIPGIRVSLSGDTDCLYFADKNNSKHHIPSNIKTYAINICHPHGCDESEEDKITVSFPLLIDNFTDSERRLYSNSLDVKRSLRFSLPENIYDYIDINQYQFNKDPNA